MYTCRMHDASGQFAYDVGLPGKSGISGAIVAVVPGRMGLAA
jgi:glutaminase